MPEEIDRGPSDRQAVWVALRTLRQRPTVAGRTDDGATVYEIRSVRLVLAPRAAYFQRLVTCAKCGREVPGASVLVPADLDRPANSVFCDRCVRSAPDPPMPGVPWVREDPPAPAPPPAAPPDVREVATEDGRLAAVEAQLAEVLSRVPLLEASLAATIDATAQSLHAALAGGLDLLRSEIASLQRRVEESAARSEVEQAAEGLDLLRAEIAGLEPRIDHESAAITARLEMQRAEFTRALHDVAQETLMAVAEPLRELTSAREDFERRLEGMQLKAEENERHIAALTAAADAHASREHALEQLIDATARQLAQLTESNAAPAPAPALRGPPVPGGIMESLERQLREAELRILQTNEAGGD